MTTRPTSEPTDSPCFALAMRKASRRLSQLYDNALQECGLRSTQFTIIAQLHLRAAEPPTLAALARALVIDRSALGHNLRPLERDGFIQLIEGERDRRERRIVLTAKGRAKYREGRALWKSAQKRFADVYGADKSAALRDALLAVAHNDRLASVKD